MNKNELKEIRNELINEFQSGNSIENISNKYRANWSDIYHIVSSCLRHSIEDVTVFEKYRIINLYQSGMSCTKIGEIMNLYHKQVAEILDEFRITRNNKSRRKYNIDESYFDIIDTQNKAYILGLFYADGYNSLDKHTVRISLQESDIDILENIRKEIKSDKPLKYLIFDDRISSNGYTSKNMYTLEFYSKHICEMLDKYGMKQNKSLILEYPDFLPESLHRHFIRGYFDGDGSFCTRFAEGNGIRDTITFTSTDSFCEKTKEIINTYTRAKGGGIYDASCKNGVTKVLSFSGSNQTKEILEWMYHDAELYLDRKHDKYINRFIA